MRHLIAILLSTLLATSALAHGGGLDRCGGHNDRKRGGYHIHRMNRYCACNPNSDVCKPGQSKIKNKQKKEKTKKQNTVKTKKEEL